LGRGNAAPVHETAAIVAKLEITMKLATRGCLRG
jgi:hypothetical protein